MYTTSQHSDGPEQLQRRRRRPPLACIACRRRKVRCDRKMPCQNCVRARRATSCAYVPDDRLEPRDRLADSQSLIEEEDHDEDDYSNRGGRAQAFHNVLDNRTSGKPDAGVRTAAGTASGLTGPYLTPDTTSGSSSANNHHHHGRHGARDSAVTEEKDGTASALAQRVRHLEQQLSEVLAAAKSSSAATAPVTSTTTGATGRPREPEISNTFLMADEIFAVKQDSQRARYRHAPTEANATTGGLLAKARYLGSSHWVHAMTLVGFPSLFSFPLYLLLVESLLAIPFSVYVIGK
ncbi:hypothetical protein BD289DRAFT_1669 [Coniella lustricola]|uniref:Zn(2)-C6 fungal-type domain-containing protein n=1 Tax=Coniella lustricola TaxID=2025994 RepID=A0A2T3ANH5_9PEZI|nr:hypothetical protein BD289DRAFT_1669 [Coniella lustricola]